jgi:predicted amidophosphoribosyltransferase
MTQLLEKAFAEASQRSEEEQDAFAAIVLAELSSERRWNELFEKSQDMLEDLAEEALAEHRKGKTKNCLPGYEQRSSDTLRAVVVVVSALGPSERHWIITAYIARRLAEGEVEWKRS